MLCGTAAVAVWEGGGRRGKTVHAAMYSLN